MYTHPYMYTYISYTLISGTTGPQRVKLVSSTPRESEEKGANPSRAFFFFHHPPTATAPWEPRFSPPAMVPPPGEPHWGRLLCAGVPEEHPEPRLGWKHGDQSHGEEEEEARRLGGARRSRGTGRVSPSQHPKSSAERGPAPVCGTVGVPWVPAGTPSPAGAAEPRQLHGDHPGQCSDNEVVI